MKLQDQSNMQPLAAPAKAKPATFNTPNISPLPGQLPPWPQLVFVMPQKRQKQFFPHAHYLEGIFSDGALELVFATARVVLVGQNLDRLSADLATWQVVVFVEGAEVTSESGELRYKIEEIRICRD